MLSIHHRGTEEVPGLVLALDAEPGARCDGMALRVAEAEVAEVHAALRVRELVSSAYIEKDLTLDLADGRRVSALTYVVDPGHRQYCRFDAATQAQMIAGARGDRGPNRDYLFNTASHLTELGLADPELDALVLAVQALEDRETGD